MTEWSEVSLEFDMILQALQRESALKWLTVTMYQQKPPVTEEEVADQKIEAAAEESKRDLKMEADAEEDLEQ